jgi:hypothetical protein
LTAQTQSVPFGVVRRWQAFCMALPLVALRREGRHLTHKAAGTAIEVI